jgi:hypothetical protein
MVPILLGRVKERPLGVGKEDAGKEHAPREEGKTPEAEREDAPVEEEAEVERGADELHEIERKIAEAGLYKLEFKCAVGADLEIVAVFPLLGLCGKILATSPKFIESCDFCPGAPMLSLNASNILCVETGRFTGAIGKTFAIALAGARLWNPPAHAQGSDGADVAAPALIQGNGDCPGGPGGAAAAAAWAWGHAAAAAWAGGHSCH